jgi:endoglucanase
MIQRKYSPLRGRSLSDRLRLLGMVLALTAAGAQPALSAGECLQGVNLAGAEFGKDDGAYGTDYIYPSSETIAYFAGKGFNSVRLPFSWPRLQPALNAEFDPAELARLKETVGKLRSAGLTVVLDPHNYARYRDELIGSSAVPNASFAQFWTELAGVFGNQDGVIFGLMNEPHDMPTEQWLEAANAAIAAIRSADAKNLILVPGNAWSGAHSWTSEGYGGANGTLMLGVKDPLDHWAYEVHQYFDEDFSGTKDNCNAAADAVASIERYTQWLRQNGKRAYLGEFGAPGTASCVAGINRMVTTVDHARDVWIGWAYWAGGDWWPEDEALNIQPTLAGDKPQLKGLTPVISAANAANCPAFDR